jgi:hypothetical protein
LVVLPEGGQAHEHPQAETDDVERVGRRHPQNVLQVERVQLDDGDLDATKERKERGSE